MVLVELIRLIIVLALTAAGYTFGHQVLTAFGVGPDTQEGGRLLASVIGAGLGYVLGGVVGRTLVTGIGAVESQVEGVSGGELVAGALGTLAGLVAGAVLAWPVLAFIPLDLLALPLAALIFVTFTYLGLRVGVRKRFDLLGMMGLQQPRSFVAEGEQVETGPKVLDTSAIIDGRIVEVARCGFLTGHLVCPSFVLSELRSIADSADGTRRARGRRGLEILEALQGQPNVRLEVTDDMMPQYEEVDAKLIAFAKRVEGALVTTDYNLHKTAELQGVPVMNVNSLAAILKPAVLPGEEVRVEILREGTQSEQGVGYLGDGTMVVVEGGKRMLGREIEVVVTSILQTAAGRMIFSTAKGPSGAAAAE